ncbi:MAG: heme o synthase [Halanaeroarchaeum sp.]
MRSPVARFRERVDAHTTGLLVASAVGVYLLVLVGATTSLLDAGGACATWPTCNGNLVAIGSTPTTVAWAHRLVAVVVGLTLVITLWAARRTAPRRVRTVVTAAALAYPGQAVLGAYIAVNGDTLLLAAIHLTVALSIFSGLLVALLWHLESRHGTPTRPPHSYTKAFSDAEPRTDERPDPGQFSLRTRVGAYVRMTKPRLMWLLALVAMAAMGLAAGPALEAGTVIATITGGVLAIGASGTFNQVYERDRDKYMDRTADRPVVTDVVPARRAIAFGVGLAVASTGVFLVFVNPLAAALGVLAILFYSVVYTMLLKPHTEHNTVLGGAVGAFPALIGWAAVTDQVGMPAIVLGAVVFLWTPAHFYNLALIYKDDYARAGYPMLPVAAGDAVTRRHILLYLGGTMVAAVVLGTAAELGWFYALASLAVGVVFLGAAVDLFRERTERAAKRTFHAANAYLGVVLLAVVFDTLLVA